MILKNFVCERAAHQLRYMPLKEIAHEAYPRLTARPPGPPKYLSRLRYVPLRPHSPRGPSGVIAGPSLPPLRLSHPAIPSRPQ